MGGSNCSFVPFAVTVTCTRDAGVLQNQVPVKILRFTVSTNPEPCPFHLLAALAAPLLPAQHPSRRAKAARGQDWQCCPALNAF